MTVVGKQERFFSGQEVIVEDLAFDQNARIDQDHVRYSDLWTSGVGKDPNGLSNMTVTIDGTTATLINVGHGTAYVNGRRIVIDASTAFSASAPFSTTNGICTSQSTGNRGVPLIDYTLNQANYVWAEYLQTVGTGRTATSVIDGSIKYPEESDGYRIVVRTTNPVGNTTGITNATYLATVYGQGVGNPLLSSAAGLTDLGKPFAHLLPAVSVVDASINKTGSYAFGKVGTGGRSPDTNLHAYSPDVEVARFERNAVGQANAYLGLWKNTTGGVDYERARIQWERETATGNDGKLTFLVNLSGSLTKYAAIGSTGFFGIGTDYHVITAAARLHTVSDAVEVARFQRAGSTASVTAYAGLYKDSLDGTNRERARIQWERETDNGNDGVLSFLTNTAGTLTTHLQISSAGVVTAPVSHIVATLGNIVASAGNINATLGKLQENGIALIPDGTAMVFFQAAAPTGWTKDTTHNDKGLRVVSGDGGGFGGTNSFSGGATLAHTHTVASHTHTTPAHTHTLATTSRANGTTASGSYIKVATGHLYDSTIGGADTIDQAQNVTTSGGSGTSGSTAPSTDSQLTDWEPLYIDVIVCTKD